MAAVADTSGAPPTGAGHIAPQPIVRKFKASDLPLPSATRSAIDNLAHAFKKKGRYDAIRKQLWAKFEAKVRFSLLMFPNCFGRLDDCLLEICRNLNF